MIQRLVSGGSGDVRRIGLNQRGRSACDRLGWPVDVDAAERSDVRAPPRQAKSHAMLLLVLARNVVSGHMR